MHGDICKDREITELNQIQNAAAGHVNNGVRYVRIGVRLAWI